MNSSFTFECILGAS